MMKGERWHTWLGESYGDDMYTFNSPHGGLHVSSGDWAMC
jgi:hypothetical protein